MKTALLTAATAAALLVSGSTFAATKSTTMNFSISVAATCEISLEQDTLETAATGGYYTGGRFEDNLGVLCSEDLPYIVEASTDANGQVIATSATSARQYPVTFTRGTDPSSSNYFGTDANGLAHAAVGTGAYQTIPFGWSFGYIDKVLAPGTYTGSVTFTVVY
ncbi:TPA: hypothetical protein ACG4ML_000411 [Stenotrophomonas maltophilia]|uniref:hypothetical protein n=1 Tax=Stenotrophomonas maltophilia TaxID=40324 RepID=UPI001131413E|nr:hypothetical protein [Stenotrophomonas maltophilia]HDS1367025.1 hypothetical protein [Stenotrophomonas maltophilia]HDS1371829.1 hypothetical protein [Stenotrophomonas maltophilia]HDS1376425.1 hypothetical protein [Stenotrophomonas maltophilia]HDS1381279.1 hypothetical protein [Stenotrophomonas maltophilia]HDS1386053.1 hypothetical protein [Stenotrophomonas maltophilia]